MRSNTILAFSGSIVLSFAAVAQAVPAMQTTPPTQDALEVRASDFPAAHDLSLPTDRSVNRKDPNGIDFTFTEAQFEKLLQSIGQKGKGGSESFHRELLKSAKASKTTSVIAAANPTSTSDCGCPPDTVPVCALGVCLGVSGASLPPLAPPPSCPPPPEVAVSTVPEAAKGVSTTGTPIATFAPSDDEIWKYGDTPTSSMAPGLAIYGDTVMIMGLKINREGTCWADCWYVPSFDVFKKVDGTWNTTAYLTIKPCGADGKSCGYPAGNYFGPMALNDHFAIVASRYNDGGWNAGKAFIYGKTGGEFGADPIGTIEMPGESSFGLAVAMTGENAVITSGSKAFIYNTTSNQWWTSPVATIEGIDGRFAAMYGDRAAFFVNGYVRVYEKAGGDWSTVECPCGCSTTSGTGCSSWGLYISAMTMSENTLAVRPSNNNGIYVYEKNLGTWSSYNTPTPTNRTTAGHIETDFAWPYVARISPYKARCNAYGGGCTVQNSMLHSGKGLAAVGDQILTYAPHSNDGNRVLVFEKPGGWSATKPYAKSPFEYAKAAFLGADNSGTTRFSENMAAYGSHLLVGTNQKTVLLF